MDQFEINTDVPDFAEGLFFQFTDPFATQQAPTERVNLSFEFIPVVTTAAGRILLAVGDV